MTAHTKLTYALICTDKRRHKRTGVGMIRLELFDDAADTYRVHHKPSNSLTWHEATGTIEFKCSRCGNNPRSWGPNLGKILYRFSEVTGAFLIDISELRLDSLQ